MVTGVVDRVQERRALVGAQTLRTMTRSAVGIECLASGGRLQRQRGHLDASSRRRGRSLMRYAMAAVAMAAIVSVNAGEPFAFMRPASAGGLRP